MYLKEQKSVTEFKEITVGIKCDVCGKIHKCSYIPDEWHNISMHHNDWGNDSVDSYESFDVCSPKCYITKLKECVKELDGRHSAEVDYFDIYFARLLVNSL